MSNNLESKIIPVISVKELLKKQQLRIPEYQRPYKWTERNVHQLIDDIRDNLDKSAYRIGTLVVHNNSENNSLDIVDGQQRTITLFLMAYFICGGMKKNESLRDRVLTGEEKTADYLPASKLEFTNPISKDRISQNAAAIRSRNSDILNEKFLKFFFEKCELVWVQIDNISEVFQFFDSQNARGKDLEPHDLLKAYHLREMNNSSTEERLQAVTKWEEMDSATLSKLFSQYLYRIRNWGKGHSARYFTKNDVGVFKGISPSSAGEFPGMKMLQIADCYIDCHSRILRQHLDFPFQIDQVIINGKRFFEYVAFYSGMVSQLEEGKGKFLNYEISLANQHQETCRWRVGDTLVRNLFFCALLYFVDKFGEKYLDQAATRIFVWAYTLRLKLSRIGIVSTDKYALAWGYTVPMFKIIRDAATPQEVLNTKLERFVENNANKVDDIYHQIKKFWGEK